MVCDSLIVTCAASSAQERFAFSRRFHGCVTCIRPQLETHVSFLILATRPPNVTNRFVKVFFRSGVRELGCLLCVAPPSQPQRQPYLSLDPATRFCPRCLRPLRPPLPPTTLHSSLNSVPAPPQHTLHPYIPALHPSTSTYACLHVKHGEKDVARVQRSGECMNADVSGTPA